MPAGDPRHTPVPTSELQALTTAVTRVDLNVRTIKEDLLPPLAADTREARDKAREALQKVDTHVADVGEHGHRCDEKDRQGRQDEAIADLRPRVAGTSRVLWWAVGIGAAVLSSAVGFALVVRAGAAETATRVEVLDRDVSRHELEIDSLEKAQARDRETFIREVRQIPTKVSAKVREEEPSEAQVDRAVEDLPLLPSERRQIRELLSRARDREDAGAIP